MTPFTPAPRQGDVRRLAETPRQLGEANTTVHMTVQTLPQAQAPSTPIYPRQPYLVLHPDTEERYTSLQDVPPFSLNNSRYSVASTAGLDRLGSPHPQLLKSSVPVGQPSHWYRTAALPKTPPPVLPPGDQYHERPPGLTRPLPEPLPKVLRVVNPDPPSATSAYIASGSSTLLPSMFRTTKKVESERVKFKDAVKKDADKHDEDRQKIESLLKLKVAHEEASSHPTSGDILKVQVALKEKRKVEDNVEDVTSKLETAFQHEEMKKSECKMKAVEKVWCGTHSTYDNCLCIAIPSPPKSPVKKVIKEPDSAPKLTGWDPIGHDNTDKVGRKELETIPVRSCTDPNRFTDFVERQRASRSPFMQHERQQRTGWQQRLAEQRKERERWLEESKESEVVRQLGEEQASEDSRDIKNKVKAGSKTPSCGRAVPPKALPEKDGVKVSTVSNPGIPVKMPNGPSSSKNAVKGLADPDTARNPVTFKAGVTQFIETVDTQYWDTLKSQASPESKSTTLSENCTDPHPKKLQEAAITKAECSPTAVTRVLQVIKALAAEPELSWDNVDLSDDEDWEKVVDDGAEWEVLEK